MHFALAPFTLRKDVTGEMLHRVFEVLGTSE